jgi:hypothetical protein
VDRKWEARSESGRRTSPSACPGPRSACGSLAAVISARVTVNGNRRPLRNRVTSQDAVLDIGERVPEAADDVGRAREEGPALLGLLRRSEEDQRVQEESVVHVEEEACQLELVQRVQVHLSTVSRTEKPRRASLFLSLLLYFCHSPSHTCMVGS